jgi:hypothetical protein
MVQAVALVASHSSVKAYNLGLYLGTSGLVLAVVLLLQNSEVLEEALKLHVVSFALRIVSIVAVFCLVGASILLPRRPDVYYNDRIVDRMYTASAYDRLTFSWTMNVLDKAKEKKDLDAVDLPRPDHYTRASDQSATWKSFNFTGPLWKSLLWAYSSILIRQWTLCIIGSSISYLPYWITLQILRRLETKRPGEPFGSNIWFLVIWLGISIIGQAASSNCFPFQLLLIVWLGY